MANLLKLYKYIDGVNDTPFPNENEQVVVSSFRYDVKRMGGAPTISLTAHHSTCLDKLWSYNVYAVFNDEKFFIKQIPSSSYSNTDARYKHDIELVSERIILDNVYVYDVVDANFDDDKPVSNSSKFSFFGTIHEFAARLNQSLAYSGLNYSVVVDNGITSEGKLLTFDDKFFSEALQDVYNTFEIPYYFSGRVIHIGYTDNAITNTFKYGVNESLLSIQKTNANYRIVNRVTGIGSSENIPYYYPNLSEKGETKALYNGEDGYITIVDTNKYDKLKVSDKLVYSSVPSKESIPFGLNDYRDLESEATSFGHIKLKITYSFTIYDESDLIFGFNVNTSGQQWNNYRLVGVDNSFEKTSLYGFEETLKAGQYNIVADIEVVSYDDRWGNVTNWAQIFISEYCSMSVKLKTKQHNGWMLEDKEVSLNEYGLSISKTSSLGDTITFEKINYITPQTSLMPPIYRESLGKERFYNALNNEYYDEEGNAYEFENQYFNGSPKEQIVKFEHIKPTIVEVRNASNQRIDMFSEFAYDLNDNDEVDENGEYIHPYFFGKLRKFDGEFGFNLFEHAIESGEMTISMTDGSCGSCNFVIGVNEDQKNIVQVDMSGNLLRDSNGNVVRVGSPQSRQNDTFNHEVWVALKKDTDSFGVVMPNATNSYKPTTNDTFVIVNINLPQAYILNAENKLKDEIIKYMWLNNSEKFTFSITFSRIYFKEHPEVLARLNENSRIKIEYDNNLYELYVSSYSYTMSDGQLLPEIKVELSDTLTITQNALQQAISEVKEDIIASKQNVDILKSGLRYFLRKDVNDRSRGTIASDKGIEVGKFASGTLGSGAAIYVDEYGNTHGEVDFWTVRRKAMFNTITIQELKHIGGELVLSAAYMVCSGVEELVDGYKCYFNNINDDGRRIYNYFEVDDQARCQTFDLSQDPTDTQSNHYYWRLVTAVGDDFIVLSKTDCDTNSDVPKAGDNIVLLGNRSNVKRQSATVLSAYGEDAPSYKQYSGIMRYSTSGKEVTVLSPKGNLMVGDFLSTSGKNLASEIERLDVDLNKVSQQVDTEFTMWFFDYDPTLTNYPSSEWVTENMLLNHVEDLFYNTTTGKAYRFINDGGVYKWEIVTDMQTVKALEDAAIANKYATEANVRLNNIVSDGMLSSVEKKEVLKEWQSVVVEYSHNEVTALSFGMDINDHNGEYYKYWSAYWHLGYYLNGNSSLASGSTPAWLQDLGTDQPIDGDTYRRKWNDYYDARAALVNKFAELAEQKADEAKTDVDAIAADNILSKAEKKEVLREWEIITSTYASHLRNADVYGVNPEALTTAYKNLGDYLNGGTTLVEGNMPLWIGVNIDENTDLSNNGGGTTYRAKWVAYYDAETALLDAVSTVINDKASQAASGGLQNWVGTQPTPPYNRGDRWCKATYGTMYDNDDLVCVTAKAQGESFSISDWEPVSYGTTKLIKETDEELSYVLTAFEKDDKGNAILKKNAGVKITEDMAAIYASKTELNTATNTINASIAGVSSTATQAWLYAQKTNYDANGNVTNINTSGLLTTSEFNSLYTQAVAADGTIMKRAEMTTYVQKNADGELESGVKISADHVNINGFVYVGNNTMEIGGWRVGEESMTVTTSNYSIELSSSGMQLNYKNGEMMSSYGAQNVTYDGQTGINIINISNATRAALGNYKKMLGIVVDGDSNDINILSRGGSNILEAGENGMTKIGGLGLTTYRSTSAGAVAPKNADFIIISASCQLPPASDVPNKVYITKVMSGSLYVFKVYEVGSSTVKDSINYTDNKTRMFISDGSNWYEISAS